MARIKGPVWKKSRRLGFSILETGEELQRRQYAPGQHGPTKRVKLTNYGLQLREKQRIRYMYGVTERQFGNLYKKAATSKGVTGETFLFMLESRLDNLVYRMGFARTRRGAGQPRSCAGQRQESGYPKLQRKAGCGHRDQGALQEHGIHQRCAGSKPEHCRIRRCGQGCQEGHLPASAGAQRAQQRDQRTARCRILQQKVIRKKWIGRPIHFLHMLKTSRKNHLSPHRRTDEIVYEGSNL